MGSPAAGCRHIVQPGAVLGCDPEIPPPPRQPPPGEAFAAAAGSHPCGGGFFFEVCMSAELKDFRGKVTVETDCVLEAINRTTGRDKSEIAREVLHKWALSQIDAATVLRRLLEVEGVPGSGDGVRGNRRES